MAPPVVLPLLLIDLLQEQGCSSLDSENEVRSGSDVLPTASQQQEQGRGILIGKGSGRTQKKLGNYSKNKSKQGEECQDRGSGSGNLF